jgi:hypothetical protein
MSYLLFFGISSKEHNKSKHLGLYKFQMDLAIDLTSRGITMDLSDIEDIQNKSFYIRKQDYVPCTCMVYFFCTDGLTHRINHNKTGERRSQSHRAEYPIKQPKVTEDTRRCTFCYKNQWALNPTLATSDIRKACKTSHLGCTVCEANMLCAGCRQYFGHCFCDESRKLCCGPNDLILCFVGQE